MRGGGGLDCEASHRLSEPSVSWINTTHGAGLSFFLQESLTNLLKTRRVGNLSECNQDFKKEEEKEEEESVSRDCTLPSI